MCKTHSTATAAAHSHQSTVSRSSIAMTMRGETPSASVPPLTKAATEQTGGSQDYLVRAHQLNRAVIPGAKGNGWWMDTQARRFRAGRGSS